MKIKHKELVEKIFKANIAYRNGHPIISDEEYDLLLESLKSKDFLLYKQVRPMLLEPTPKGKAESVELPVVVGSLEKLRNGYDDEIIEWDKNQKTKEYVISSKVDGLSLLICYYNGELKLITTRGDGKFGENKTDKLREIAPKLLYGDLANGLVIIRGEGVLTEDSFNELNRVKGMSYRSRRNAAVGLVNSAKQHEDLAKKYLTFVAYQIYKSQCKFEKYSDILKALDDAGFYTPKAEIVRSGSLNSKSLMELYEDHLYSEDFDIDGLVIQNNEVFNECDKLIPKHSIAFKANKLVDFTEIVGYEWEVSKDGSLRPVARVKPLVMNGATITRASAYNSEWIEENKCGIGAKVVLQMQGDIIPGIIEVMKSSTKYQFPEICPCCGSKIVRDGKFHYCSNPSCKIRTTKSLAYFLKNLEVSGISYVSLMNWKVNTINDVIDFIPDPSSKQQVLFYKEIEKKLWSASFVDLVKAFDYNGVGASTIQKLIDANSLDVFIERFFGDASEGIVPGSKTKIKLCQGVTDLTCSKIDASIKKNNLINAFYSIIYNNKWTRKSHDGVKKETTNNTGIDLNGQSFCFTGALLIPRKMAEALVVERGGSIKNAVTNALTYLVTNDTESGSSKNKKAKELGVKVIDEKTFYSVIKYDLPENLKTLAEEKKKMNHKKIQQVTGIEDI